MGPLGPRGPRGLIFGPVFGSIFGSIVGPIFGPILGPWLVGFTHFQHIHTMGPSAHEPRALGPMGPESMLLLVKLFFPKRASGNV